MQRSRWTRLGSVVAVALMGGGLSGTAEARRLDIRDDLSARNRERPRRPHTRFIVLHTTEGPGRGSLRKLKRDGEAHYMVDERGRVFRIIDKHRVAYHAGTSMWAGHRNIDRHSVGIEVAGYHDRSLRPPQIAALKELLRQLQSIFDISDENVLTHSMVAYGEPNKYHRYPHRGRKRCGMVFADPKTRAALGLSERPRFDPDVRARRVRVADHALHDVLFPRGLASDLPLALSDRPRPVGQPSTDRPAKRLFGGRVMVLQRSAVAAPHWLGDAHDDLTTIYIFPSGLVRTGRALSRTRAGRKLLADLPAGTRVLPRHVFGGYVTADRPPSQIAGPQWNQPDTLYRLPTGDLVPGHRVKADRLPRSTLVFPPA